MEMTELRNFFQAKLAEDPDMSESVAAIATLTHFVDYVSTLSELDKSIKQATQVLKSSEPKMTASITSGCELFLLFISRTDKLELTDFEEIKRVIRGRSEHFLAQAASARSKIAQQANKFINSDTSIFLHSRSRVVLEVMKRAAADKKEFTVYITESHPDGSGKQMAEDLRALGIHVIVVLDSAVAYVMELVDMVLVGAEGVCENGGIINKIGTCTLGMIAQKLNKPFYVVAESFKFMRLFPLNNRRGIPTDFKYESSCVKEEDHPWVDYTDPEYIRLLITDLGVLPPSNVGDELLRLYI